MNKRLLFLILFFSAVLFSGAVSAQSKLAQTGLQFLSVSTDARTASLSGAVTSVNNYSNSIFTNPAMLAEMNSTLQLSVNYNLWIADIKYNSFSAAFNPSDGLLGIFGISFVYVDYGTVEGTIIAQNNQGFIDVGNISPSAYSIGLAYSKALTDKFSVGGHVKYVSQNLGSAYINYDEENISSSGKASNKVSAVAFDFGTIYKTGFKSLAFGISVQNFSKEIKFVRESFQLPLTFNIGISMNMVDFMREEFRSHTLLLSIDAVHPRSYPEQLKLGLEYEYLNILSLRVGYISSSDLEKLSYGIGIHKFGLSFDYSYTPNKFFNNVQRFTLSFVL
ncbi:hypothetical protein BMS3Abin04_01641 [bacterium BMS3Abin04]|nr:hypothetical protein BMS3Abin04_01641 [bacterium BMS3Abin04]